MPDPLTAKERENAEVIAELAGRVVSIQDALRVLDTLRAMGLLPTPIYAMPPVDPYSTN